MCKAFPSKLEGQPSDVSKGEEKVLCMSLEALLPFNARALARKMDSTGNPCSFYVSILRHTADLFFLETIVTFSKLLIACPWNVLYLRFPPTFAEEGCKYCNSKPQLISFSWGDFTRRGGSPNERAPEAHLCSGVFPLFFNSCCRSSQRIVPQISATNFLLWTQFSPQQKAGQIVVFDINRKICLYTGYFFNPFLTIYHCKYVSFIMSFLHLSFGVKMIILTMCFCVASGLVAQFPEAQ